MLIYNTGNRLLRYRIYERRIRIMSFDISAILDKINVEEILAQITDLLAKIDFQAILQKIIEFVTGLITK